MKQRWLVTLVILSTFSYSVEAYNYAARYRTDQDESKRLEEMAQRLGVPVEKLRREQPGLVDALKGLFQNPEEATRQAGMARVEAQLKRMSEQVAANPYRPGIEDVKNAYRGHQLDGLLRDLSQLTSTRVIELPVASRKALLRSLRARLEEDLLPYVPDDLPGKGKGRHNQLKGKLSSLYAKLRPILSHPDALSDDKLAQTLGKMAAEVNELVQRPERGPRFADGRPLPLQLLAKGMPTQESTTLATGSSSALVQAPAPARRVTAPAVAPEIATLVQSLGSSPARIFGHVHDTIRFDPKWGAVRSPLGTLQEGEGTSWDQAWLLLEMLTAAGVDAKLEWGQVEIPVDLLLTLTGTSDPLDAGTLLTTGGVPGVLLVQGGKVVGARLSHVWVQAHIDYIPNRGVTPGEGDTWIRMDPSFKRYGFSPGIDAHSHVPFSLESYLRSGTPMSPRRAYEDALWSYIRANNIPCTTLEQLKKSAEVKRERFPFVPGTLRGKILRSDGTSPTMPEAFQQRLALEVRTAGGSPLVSWSSTAPALYGRRVEITYVGATSEDQDTIDAYGGIFETPPYLVDLKPTVRVAGTVVAGAGAVGAGADTEVWVTTTPPSGAPTVVSYATSAGERHVLAVDFGELPQAVIDAHQQALNAALAAGNEAEAEAESLYLLGAQYLHNLGRDLTDLSGWKWQRLVRLGTEGLISQTGIVTTTVGGAPISFRRGERNVDIARMPLGMVPADGREQGARESFELLGAQSSYLEGEVFNQVLQREGIASVSALTRAKREGQEVARVDGANMGAVLSQVDLGADAEAEVRAAVSRGRIAWVAESRLSVHQWTGTGYVLEDPDTGAAAYLISGGYGGGSDTGGGLPTLQDILGDEPWLAGSPLAALLSALAAQTGGNPPADGPSTQQSDPINLSTGNLWFTESDLSIQAQAIPVAWFRTYNSRSAQAGPLGFGWAFPYGVHLEEQVDGSVIYHEGDGTEHQFAQPVPGTYVSPPGKHLALTRSSSGWTSRTPEGVLSSFSTDGRLLAVTDPNGNAVSLGYDSSANLASVTDAMGRTVLTVASAGGKITEIRDLAGRTVTYQYTGDDLTSVIDTAGKIWSYFYDADHNLIAKANPLGQMDSYAYDALDRCHRHQDPLGYSETYAYTSHGERAVLTGRRGYESYLEFDGRGRATIEVDPLGNARRSTWDGDNNRTSITDPRGGMTTRTFDERGNLLTETDPLNGTIIYTYDPVYSRVLTQTDAAGHTVSYAYDELGNLRSQTQVVSGQTLTETFEYDAMGRITKRRSADNQVATYAWDANTGALASQTDVLGRTTTYETDDLGRVKVVQDPANGRFEISLDSRDLLTSLIDPLGRATTFVYDDAGRPTSVATPRSVSLTTYDAAGQAITVRDALGHETRTEYDPEGRVVARVDARGSRMQLTYDPLGRSSAMVDALGNAWLFGYCAEIGVGSPPGGCGGGGCSGGGALRDFCELTDPLGNTTRQEFDPLGRVKEVIDPNGNRTRIEYDALGRTKAVTDALDRVKGYEYDDLGRLTAVVEANGSRTEHTYGLNGHLSNVRDAEGRNWARTYDQLARLTAKIDPLGHATRLFYNAQGKLDRKVNAEDEEIRFEYDQRRLAAVVLPGNVRESFGYDSLGRKTSMSNSEVSLRYVYDDLNRLAQVVNETLGQTIGYEYDPAGNRTKTIGPRGSVIYVYDAKNRLVEQRDPATGTYRYEYDAADRRTAVRYPNGLSTSYEYDRAGQLLAILTKNSQGVVVDGYSYTYDAGGNRQTMTSLRESVKHVYTYDEVDRLTRWQRGDSRFEEYAYDAVGNRLQLNDETGSTVYSVDLANRLVEEARSHSSGGITLTRYGWDAAGRRTSKAVTPDGASTATTNYSWDALDRLLGVVSPEGAFSYGYNPEGIRVRETEGGSTKRLLHSLEDIVAVYDEQGTLDTYYSHGPGFDEPLAQTSRDSPEPRYFHRDALGSITASSTASLDRIDLYSYSPFGSPEGSPAPAGPGFAGHRQLRSSLLDMRFRAYDPDNGLFLSTDPAEGRPEKPSTGHPFVYVSNNPTNLVDPLGAYEIGTVALGAILVSVAAMFMVLGVFACLGGKAPREMVLTCFMGALLSLINAPAWLAILAAIVDDYATITLYTFIAGDFSFTEWSIITFLYLIVLTFVMGRIIDFVAGMAGPGGPWQPNPKVFRGIAAGMVFGAVFWAEILEDEIPKLVLKFTR